MTSSPAAPDDGDHARLGTASQTRGFAEQRKSRLIAEVTAALASQDVPTYQGDGQPFGARTSYFAWTPVWTALLDVPDDTPARRVDAVRAAVRTLAPDLLARVPLLGAVVGDDITDSELTQAFDAKLRKASCAPPRSAASSAAPSTCARSPAPTRPWARSRTWPLTRRQVAL